MFVSKILNIVLFLPIYFSEFLLEFKPEDQYNKVRDLTGIAKRYIKGQFAIDVIALLPFSSFFTGPQRKLWYIIKIVRIQKGYHLLSSNTFMRQVKMLFSKNLERIIQNEPELAENSDLDNNNIMLILMISYFFKTFKLVIIILTVSYFIGMVWYIYCDLTSTKFPVTSETCPDVFSQDYCDTVDFS